MMAVRRVVVVVVATLIGLFAARPAHALGIPTTYEYSYAAGQTVLWEHDKHRCAMPESTCFVLFERRDTPSRHAAGMRFAQLSRPTDAPLAVGLTAAGDDAEMRWVVVDLQSRETVVTTTIEAEARARFSALTGAPPVMMDARNGAPTRPLLWRTASDVGNIFTEDAPLATMFGAIYLFPFYLAAMAGWIAAICAGVRHHRDGTRIALTVGSVLTAPFVPYVFWVGYLLLSA